MTPTFDLSPAPGRLPFPLENGWTAILLEPLPGAGVLAVGFFHAGELELVVDEPAEVRALVRRFAAPARAAACGSVGRRTKAPQRSHPPPGPVDVLTDAHRSDTGRISERRGHACSEGPSKGRG